MAHPPYGGFFFDGMVHQVVQVMPYLPNGRYLKALQHNGCICLLAGHRAEFLDLVGDVFKDRSARRIG